MATLMKFSSNFSRTLHQIVRQSPFQSAIPVSSTAQHDRRYSHAASLPNACYGGRHTITLLPGDGIGPELINHVREVFRYAGAPVDFEEIPLNRKCRDPKNIEHALLAVKRNGVGLKGNIETDISNPLTQSTNIILRTQLDLFASVMKCKSIPGVDTRHKNIDLVIIRENTEGEYSNLEHENVKGVVESLKIITERKSSRIAKFAFDYAIKHDRQRVTAVHKANIMKLGDGLFLESCRKMARHYPTIELNDMIIDNASMQMVSKPQQFDVLVMPNLYGNILGNIAAGLIGGPGVVAGTNMGHQYAVFETGTRNSGRSIAQKNIANPSGMLLASCDMLEYVGCEYHATLIRDSVCKVMSELQIHTPDLGGQNTSLEVVQAIIKDIQDKMPK
ncbi:isocitrate dehydrogenase [NAD] subunit gamma, mitochondrial-like isoform X2 [Tubulanus polymorphus]